MRIRRILYSTIFIQSNVQYVRYTFEQCLVVLSTRLSVSVPKLRYVLDGFAGWDPEYRYKMLGEACIASRSSCQKRRIERERERRSPQVTCPKRLVRETSKILISV